MIWLTKIAVKLVSWLFRRFNLPRHCMMHVYGAWVFVDAYGTVWLLRPTMDPSMPLQITCERRP